ncbi:MAG: tetratricopeptide repeat protein [Candidatus Heimdallarchaeota archaeon]
MVKKVPNNSISEEELTFYLAREKWVSGSYEPAKELLSKLSNSAKSTALKIQSQNELGHLAVDSGKHSEAFEFYQSAKKLAEQHKMDEMVAWALLGLSAVAFGTGELDRGLHYATSALHHFRNSSDGDLGFLEATRLQALHYLIVGEYEKSQEYLRFIINGLESKENLGILAKVYLARAWNLMSAIHNYTGNNKASLEACKKSYGVASEASEHGYRSGMGLAANNMGEVYRNLGEYKKALAYYEEALGIHKGLGADVDTATALHNIALVYSTRGEYQQAADYFEQSKMLIEVHGSILDQAVLLGDIARHEHVFGDFRTAKQLFEESIQLYRESGSEEELVEKLCWFSGALVELGTLKRAERLIREAEDLSRKHNSRSDLALCRYHLGVLENIRENYGLAQSLFSEALDEAETLGMRQLAIDSHINLAELAMRRYRLSLNSSEFEIAMEHVAYSESLAKKEGLLGSIINTKMIISALLMARLNFQKSLEVLEDIITLSKEHDLPLQLRRALTQKAALENRRASVSSSMSGTEEIRELAAENAQRYMRIATQRSRTPAMPDFDPEKLFVTVIAYGIRGPEVIVTQSIPFPISDQESEELFLKMEVFYSAALAQGSLHHQGLYGPLPLSSSIPYSSLIFAITLPDKTHLDQRMRDKSYTLVCLSYPIVFDPYFVDRGALEEIFEESLASIADLSMINLKFLAKIKKGIVEHAFHAWTPDPS